MNKKEILNITYKYLKENQNYIWLKTRLNEAVLSKDKNITLITGSSYALNGIDVYCFENAINCSMNSQDIYYDYLCAKYILSRRKTKNISKCFIMMGYYTAFQDLSRAEKVGRDFIKKVYYPIMQDSRNWDTPEIYDMWEWAPDLPEEEKYKIAENAIEMMWHRKQYYSDLRIRVPFFNFEGKKWNQLELHEKDAFGAQRASLHNKLLQHDSSYVENIAVLQEFIEMLMENNIKPILVVPPFTDAYNKHVDVHMKERFYEMIAMISKEKMEFLDFNAEEYFEDNDFIDSDHLNGKGAYKMSVLLAERYGK